MAMLPDSDRMKKRRIFVVIFGCLAVAALALALWPHEREPEYNGISLSTWLERYKARNNTLETFAAIRRIGTNGLPFLLRWIQYESPGWRKSLYSAVWKLPRPVSGSHVVTWLLRDQTEE